MIERERQRHRQREAGSMYRELDVGLDPGSPESHPGPKAGTKPLCHPGIPWLPFLDKARIIYCVIALDTT